MRRSAILEVGSIVVSSIAGCSSEPLGTGSDEQTGQLSAALSTGSQRHDVAAIDFKVVPRGASCDGVALQEQVVDLERQSSRPELLGDGAGAAHPFADGLFVLASGTYTLCAKPLDGSGHSSSECMPASKDVFVHGGVTTEVVLVSQCQGDDSGAADGVVALNDPPHIDDIDIGPSKFIGLCEDATLVARASDPNGDALTYQWRIVSSPHGPAADIVGEGERVTFTPGAIGDYELELRVEDGFKASTTLNFPIHVDNSCIPASADTSIRTDLDARRNDNYGCQLSLEVGNSRGGGGIPENGPDAIRTLIAFDVSSLPDASEIESAVLELTVEGFEDGPPSVFRIDVHPITESGARTPWREGNGVEFETVDSKLFDPPAGCVDPDSADGVAWATGERPDDANNQAMPNFNKPWTTGVVDSSVVVPGDVVRLDLTNMVRAWRSGTLPNYGIMLRDTTTTNRFRTIRFGSRDAKLRHYPSDTVSPPRWLVVDGPRLVVTQKP